MVAMFTPQDLIQALEQMLAEPLPLAETSPVKAQEHLGGYEDTFWFFRGNRNDFRSSSHFWALCMVRQWARLEPDTERIARNLSRIVQGMKKNLSEHYEEISPEIFSATIQQYSQDLITRNIAHTYEWNGTIRDAMRLCEEWNEVIVIGKTDEEFVAFHWETGA